MGVRHALIVCSLSFAALAHGDTSHAPTLERSNEEDRSAAQRPLDAVACAGLLPALDVVGRCWLTVTALGRARVVHVEGGCHLGACADSIWILDATRGARRLPDDLGWDGVAVLPSLEEAIVDDRAGLVRVALRRSTLMRGERFARCLAPSLSPAGRFIVCRDHRAGVFRVPVVGGSIERVYRWPDHVYDYSGPVEFVAPDKMYVGANMTGDSATSRLVSWRE